jgi:EAL domain-containing protein (putative c-di-GMP-specific phosphodiesterase class I)
MAPEHGDEAAKLLQGADVAMYAAKVGGTGVAVYERARDRSSLRHLALAGALRRAIEGGGLDLRYQPKICLATGRLLGAEALVRWTCPELGVVAPDEFVPHAERSGLIHDLLAWTLDAALAQAAALAARGVRFPVAVNTSCLSLQGRGLHDAVAAALARHRVDPGLLTLELTERAVLRDPDGAAEILGRLHEAGVRLSVDDFGTGYSSLALLQRLAVDEVKIDRSFVARMTRSRSDLVLVRSTVELAHNLGLVAVAEGVEEKEQARLLRQLGCDAAQGFLFAPALPGAEVAAWLAAQPAAAAA